MNWAGTLKPAPTIFSVSKSGLSPTVKKFYTKFFDLRKAQSLSQKFIVLQETPVAEFFSFHYFFEARK
jgi:hypothetical protein